MGWTIWYELRRDQPLSDTERAELVEHEAKHSAGKWKSERYHLDIAPKPGVLCKGITKVPFDPGHRDVTRILEAVTELRAMFPDAECDVGDDFEVVYWDEDQYTTGAFASDDEDDGDDEDDDSFDDVADSPPRNAPPQPAVIDRDDRPSTTWEIKSVPTAAPSPPRRLRGALQISHDSREGLVGAALTASLDGRDLTVTIELTTSRPALEVSHVLFVARARDGAPCFAKVIWPSGMRVREKLYVSDDFAAIATAFELYAQVRYRVDELIASYDVKAAPAETTMVPIELDPRTPPAGIGLDLVSLEGWAQREYGEQAIWLFARAKPLDALLYDVSLVFNLVDEAGKLLQDCDGRVRLPVPIVRAGRSQLSATLVAAVRRIDVHAKGTIEGQLPLGVFRVTR